MIFEMSLQNTVDKLVQRANASLLIGTSSWKEQFVEALTVSASNEDEQKSPSKLDYFMHCLTVFWKVIFAFVPPTGKNQNPFLLLYPWLVNIYLIDLNKQKQNDDIFVRSPKN